MIDRPDLHIIAGERQEVRKPRLVPIPWERLHLLPKRRSLVAGLLDTAAMSVIFGASGSCKTFIAIDLAAHIALEWEWCGFPVEKGAVAYVAAEGGLGIEERLTAFRLHHNLGSAAGVPLFVVPEAIDLCRTKDDTEILLTRLRELPEEPKIALLVIDTLSRAMAGGNENSPDDMGRFVANCDRIRAATGAHLLAIHHSGKDDSRGARGHSLLRAAADTEIEVSRSEVTGIITATVAKQRDRAGGQSFVFTLQEVEIGHDEHDRPITSAVIVPADNAFAEAAPKKKLTPAATIALRALREAIDELGEKAPASNHIPPHASVVTLDVWRRYAYARGVSGSDKDRARQTAFQRASECLVAANLAALWERHAWLTS
jgi:hypothetical protein